jgi:hypothetical protein
MLAPVGGVSSTTPIPPLNPARFDRGTPVANVDTQQLQLERQLQIYNQQLAVAQEAARRAEQLQRQIAAVEQQLEQRQLENARAADLQASNAADDVAAEELRTDNLLADQRADDLTAERLADERLAADRLAADQLADEQNAVIEPQFRPPIIDASDQATTLNTQGTEPSASNEDLIPPLAPDDSGRLINTLV